MGKVPSAGLWVHGKVRDGRCWWIEFFTKLKETVSTGSSAKTLGSTSRWNGLVVAADEVLGVPSPWTIGYFTISPSSLFVGTVGQTAKSNVDCNIYSGTAAKVAGEWNEEGVTLYAVKGIVLVWELSWSCSAWWCGSSNVDVGSVHQPLGFDGNAEANSRRSGREARNTSIDVLSGPDGGTNLLA